MIRKDGQLFRQVDSPTIGSIVNYHKDENEYYPVYITGGCLYDPIYQRLSNAWSWHKINEDGTLGESESGYGFFSETNIKYDVEVKIFSKEI